jgi:hypothetical protein
MGCNQEAFLIHFQVPFMDTSGLFSYEISNSTNCHPMNCLGGFRQPQQTRSKLSKKMITIHQAGAG